MILTSLYFGMLFLNWGDTGLEEGEMGISLYASAQFSTWAKIVA
jgi:hypothetical protein